MRLRNTGFEELSGTTVHVAAVGEHSEVTDAEGAFSSAPGEDISVEIPVTLREASDYELVRFDARFADSGAGIAPATLRAGFRVHYDVAHTEKLDSADNPVTQSDWFMELFLPYGETVWRRVANGDGDAHAYTLEGARIDQGATRISPCVLAAEDEDLIVRFSQAYQLNVFGNLEVRTAGSDEFDWQVVYSLPSGGSAGMEPAEINLLRQYAGQWLQIRFDSFAPPATSAGVPSWTIDDIEIEGIENPPFAAILPQGSAP